VTQIDRRDSASVLEVVADSCELFDGANTGYGNLDQSATELPHGGDGVSIQLVSAATNPLPPKRISMVGCETSCGIQAPRHERQRRKVRRPHSLFIHETLAADSDARSRDKEATLAAGYA